MVILSFIESWPLKDCLQYLGEQSVVHRSVERATLFHLLSYLVLNKSNAIVMEHIFRVRVNNSFPPLNLVESPHLLLSAGSPGNLQRSKSTFTFASFPCMLPAIQFLRFCYAAECTDSFGHQNIGYHTLDNHGRAH